MPAGEGGDEVGEGEGVEGDAQGLARDAGPDGGAEPGLPVVVGRQVRGDGALLALGG